MIGNTNHDMMKLSLETTLKNVNDVEDILIFSDSGVVDYGTHIPIKSNFDVNDYNFFCLKNLWAHVRTEFVLIIQYDGMAANKDMWTDEFYNYDYIGAPWPDRFQWIGPDEKVGNGGFSLRSAKLLEALKDKNIYQVPKNIKCDNEDAVICQAYNKYLRENHDIKYAPIELANNFAHEWCNPSGRTFGFHGVFNFPLFFDEETTIKHLITVPKSHWFNDKYEMFVQNCQRRGYQKAIAEVTKGLMSQ